MSDSEINVDQLMYEIRETVARQHLGPSQNGSESSSGFSLATQPPSDSQSGSSSLNLQPEFHLQPNDQYHINDFLKYHREDFLRNAYRALLKREPDQSGWTQYLGSLESGRLNKIDVLASLRYSPEGERAQVKVAGLAWPAAIRRFERLPIIGYLLEVAIAVTRLPRLLRHLRQSEFYLLGQVQRTMNYDDQVHKQLEAALVQVSAQTLAGTERGENQQQAIAALLRQQQDMTARQNEFKDAIDAIETRFANAREYVDESTATLTGKVEEQKQLRQQLVQTVEEQNRQLSEGQQQLAQQMKQQTDQLAQQMEAQDRQLTEGQQQLAQQVEEQTEGLRRRQQETHTELVMQERRLTSLLEEARANPPGAPSSFPDSLAVEEDHLLDPLYASFEDQFRGEREEVKNRLRVYLPILKDAAVTADALDIGCGRGEWLELLKNDEVQGRGVDHNRVFVDQCRQIGLDVVEADALAYLRSLPEKSLNVITSFHLVEHLAFEELIKLLDEMVRTLRSGGVLILETPNPENFMVGSYNFYADPTHRNPIPAPTLKFLLESRGLGRIEVMKLRPWDAAKIDGDSEIIKRFNEYFYSAPDYGIVGWKA
jgi:O-antigen chain-terminating methyltransferase